MLININLSTNYRNFRTLFLNFKYIIIFSNINTYACPVYAGSDFIEYLLGKMNCVMCLGGQPINCQYFNIKLEISTIDWLTQLF